MKFYFFKLLEYLTIVDNNTVSNKYNLYQISTILDHKHVYTKQLQVYAISI